MTLSIFCWCWKTLNEPRHDKTNKITVRPAKTQISLGIRPVWSESSLCAQWVAKEPSFLHADSEDSDQTGRMPRLIWVFAGRTLILLVLSCRGSNVLQLQIKPWTHFFHQIIREKKYKCENSDIFTIISVIDTGSLGKLTQSHFQKHTIFQSLFENKQLIHI